MTTLRRRAFVSWSEFRGMAVADYEAAGDRDCQPVDADLVMVSDPMADHLAAPCIVVSSQECGELATYRPSIDDDGRPVVQRLSLHHDHLAEGRRSKGDGDMTKHWSEIDWEALADREVQWRRALRRAREMWEEGRRGEVSSDALESLESLEMKHTDGPDSTPGQNPMNGVSDG